MQRCGKILSVVRRNFRADMRYEIKKKKKENETHTCKENVLTDSSIISTVLGLFSRRFPISIHLQAWKVLEIAFHLSE